VTLTPIGVTLREALRNHINDHCIMRVPQGSKEMPAKGGQGYYTWQFYLRSAVLRADHLTFIAQEFWSRFFELSRKAPFQIAGVEQACIPMLTAILMDAGVDGVQAFTIRKEFKTYGLGNIIEGEPSDLPVLFVDDLTSPQHHTFWHFVRVIKRAGLQLYPHAFVLVRKQRAAESPIIATSFGPITVEGIFTLDDFDLDFRP